MGARALTLFHDRIERPNRGRFVPNDDESIERHILRGELQRGSAAAEVLLACVGAQPLDSVLDGCIQLSNSGILPGIRHQSSRGRLTHIVTG